VAILSEGMDGGRRLGPVAIHAAFEGDRLSEAARSLLAVE
jgi:hypothetical protein